MDSMCWWCVRYKCVLFYFYFFFVPKKLYQLPLYSTTYIYYYMYMNRKQLNKDGKSCCLDWDYYESNTVWVRYKIKYDIEALSDALKLWTNQTHLDIYKYYQTYLCLFFVTLVGILVVVFTRIWRYCCWFLKKIFIYEFCF